MASPRSRKKSGEKTKGVNPITATMTNPIEGLSTAGAAELLGMSMEGVRQAIFRGELAAIVIRRGRFADYLLQKEDVLAFDAKRKEEIAEGKRAGRPARGDREPKEAENA